MRPKVYATDHVHSKILCQAFSEGCNGSIVPPGRLLSGPAVVYGILRGCGDIIKQCQWVKRDFYHIDHGYFKRGHYKGYYRVTKNAFQCGPGASESRRWDSLGIPLLPWRKDGRHVVICPISNMVAEFLGIDPKKWLDTVISEISLHTDRPIIVKPKDGKPLSKVLKGAWCLVTHTSNAAVDAVVSGIPVLVLGGGACEPVSWGFEHMESPVYPERESWVRWLAVNQWTIEEMKSGRCWDDLNGENQGVLVSVPKVQVGKGYNPVGLD